jgi:hypothetical protein
MNTVANPNFRHMLSDDWQRHNKADSGLYLGSHDNRPWSLSDV